MLLKFFKKYQNLIPCGAFFYFLFFIFIQDESKVLSEDSEEFPKFGSPQTVCLRQV